MRLPITATLLVGGMIGFGYLVKPAAADDWNEQTILHFNQPVEIPGRVLTAGTYEFRLANNITRDGVIQIFSQDRRGRDHFVADVLAMPAYRLVTPDKTIITFAERRHDSPEALDKWFYPGDNFGWQFVYPPGQHLENGEAAHAARQSSGG